MKTRIAKQDERGASLRFSSLGKPNRQQWYDHHPEEGQEPERISNKTYLKFLLGDVYEALLIFLAREAGHTVEQEQAEVNCDGVLGHIDAVVDGRLVDFKTASPYGFQKFKKNTIVEDDPFGYVQQLSGYAHELDLTDPPAWVAIDKVSAEICVTPLSSSVVKDNNPLERINELRSVLDNDEPPPRCHDPVPDGKAGNYKLVSGCSYCSHRWRCHPNLRAFAYSGGPRFLTTVVREPEVPEFYRKDAVTDTETETP